jgi:hypothetical protein
MIIDALLDMLNITEYIQVFQQAIFEKNNGSTTMFNIPLVDVHDFYKLAFKFAFYLFFTTILIRYIYYPKSKKKDYLFTYFLIGISVFMISITLENVKLELGFALGLFAIFGIIRYRTDAIDIKEMTYLFVVIGLAVMNALANKKVSFAELIFANSIVLIISYGLEHLWLVKNEIKHRVNYERIELIKPKNHKKLLADLTKRTGLKINRIDIRNIDFLKDVARIDVYYFEGEQEGYYNPEFVHTSAMMEKEKLEQQAEDQSLIDYKAKDTEH